MHQPTEPRCDSTGRQIKLHDVLRDDETGEMALVVQAVNKKQHISGLAVENKINGIGDWLTVYPDGVWTIVGNAATVVLR
ncbi:MAG: hypothetical protein ABF586_12390 [Sporolactobacillus sp.]